MSERWFMKIKKRIGSRTLPWETPSLTESGDERIQFESHALVTRVHKDSKPCVEVALYAIGREFGGKGRMPYCIKSSRFVWRDGPDLMSDIEGLYPLLGAS